MFSFGSDAGIPSMIIILLPLVLIVFFDGIVIT
nr:MAG TPA: Protein of unknown function (DUF3149) [Caudoviricetes sp.]